MPAPALEPAATDRFIALAEACADAAGEILVRHFRTAVAVDTKPDATPVTVADRDAEAAMRALIAGTLPDHGIVGEEMPPRNPGAEFTWVIDPIDGTKSFITGKATFGTLVALAHNGRPLIGLINQPIQRERWIGAEGRATVFNGAPARVRACSRVADAILYTTSPYLFPGGDEDRFHRLRTRVRHALFGGDCYSYGLLALGHADIVVESGLKPYDYAALVPVIEGAGGVITDWDGQPLTLASDGRVLAAGDAGLHRDALAILQSG